jgi:Mg-chelatase subunit ChlD
MIGKSLIFWICLVALCGLGCRAEKAQDIRPAERVELLALDENDPRPYFHAELKFANPDQVKLPASTSELQKRIRVREASSLFMREGRDFTPFKVSNRATEGKLDVMMLFDLSGSMITGSLGGRARIEAAKDAARVLVEKFRPGDRIAIAPFESHDVRARIENAVFAKTPEAAEAQIDSLQARRDGNTALYSATIFALDRLQRRKKEEPDRQYMLVILTDGKNDLREGDDQETLQRKDDLDSVVKKLYETNTQTFTIGVGDAIDAGALKEMVYPQENKEQYSKAEDTRSLASFLAGAKQSLNEQIGIQFFTRRRDYHDLKSLNFRVQVETLDKKILQGVIPWNCRAAAGCAPDRTMEREEMRLATESADAPQPPPPQWKELLWLLVRFAIALAILAGLWFGIPKIVWPAPPLPHIPVRGGVKLPPSRGVSQSGPKSRMAPPAPGEPGRGAGSARPRQGFEETRMYDNKRGH